MANKVLYNNINYDILDAITLVNRDYLILVDSTRISNITFLESTVVDGKLKYSLPPKGFDVANNLNGDLKRLQVNFIVSRIVEILKREVNNGTLMSPSDIKTKFEQIKNFVYTDLTIRSILEDYKNLSAETFSRISDYLEKYMNEQFAVVVKNDKLEQYNYLDRPLKTSEGLDYDWLYNLELGQLKELASSNNRTSEELIYILDALDKRQKTDQAINNYTEMGRVMTLSKRDNTAAFIDTVLLSLITASFALLLLLNIF